MAEVESGRTRMASEVENTPAGDIVATDVQAAINELDNEKVATTDSRLEKIVYVKVIANDTALTTGDGAAYFTIPDSLDGMNLIDADIAVYTASSGGLPTVQLNNLDYVGGATDMLSTEMTIDVGELNSYTATTPPVIDATKDDVSTGDRIRIDVDIAGTSTTGLDVILTFNIP